MVTTQLTFLCIYNQSVASGHFLYGLENICGGRVPAAITVALKGIYRIRLILISLVSSHRNSIPFIVELKPLRPSTSASGLYSQRGVGSSLTPRSR